VPTMRPMPMARAVIRMNAIRYKARSLVREVDALAKGFARFEMGYVLAG
jgi:hypothetical protein